MSRHALPSSNGDDPPRLDPRLIEWLAVQMVQDARARLVEGGAGADTAIELTSVFVDLQVTVRGERERRGAEEGWVIQKVCAQHEIQEDDEGAARRRFVVPRGTSPDRWLVVGGPGSGKSTATTMIAQLLRRPWVEGQRDAVSGSLKTRVDQVSSHLEFLRERLAIETRRGLLPLRVNLPSLAQWMASQSLEEPAALLWRHLATRMIEDAAAQDISIAVTERDVESMVSAAPQVLWIFDGLDEVPRTAGRDKVVAVVRAALGALAGRAPGILVTTRPQGYEGELDDLATMVLSPMTVEQARDYGDRLLRAWLRDDAELAARREAMSRELERPEIQALVQTPLHTTMAALLVGNSGDLPRSRWLLFDHYFTTIFQREVGKPGGHGFRAEDRRSLRDLHARVGLALHVRAQDQAGTRPALSRRELREELAAIFRERGHAEEDVAQGVDRVMRFATERLVLLLHARSGEYSFGVRSLQEFFAADALLRGERAQVRGRLEAVALNPHWSNVLALVASKCALADGGQAEADLIEYTVGLCRALNDGAVGGEAARRCLLGSRLALAMLREVERYGEPWLLDPLWEVALQAATSPVQIEVTVEAMRAAWESHEQGTAPSLWNDGIEIHMRLGLLAARGEGFGKKRRRDAVREAARGLLEGTEDQRLAGWLLLYGLLLVDDPEAVALADQHAPAERDEVRRVVSLIDQAPGDEPVPSWMVHLLDSHPGCLTPAFVPRRLLYEPELCQVAWFDVAHLLLALSPSRISLHVGEGALQIVVTSVDPNAARWQALQKRLPEQGLEWEIWRRLAAFHVAPSHGALADVLEAAAEPAAFKEILRKLIYFAWPIVGCMKRVVDPEEVHLLAQAARRGDLGTVEDWHAAESRWRAVPNVSQHELAEWLKPGPLPWTPHIGKAGVVLAWFLMSADNTSGGEPRTRSFCEFLFQHLGDDLRASVRAMDLLWSFLPASSLFEGLAVPGAIPLEVVRKTDKLDPRGTLTALFCVHQILPDLEGPQSEEWFALLEERGRQSRNRSSESSGSKAHVQCCHRIAGALLRRLRERPDQWGLTDALVSLLPAVPDIDLSSLPPLPIPENAPLEALANAAFLRLVSGDHDADDRAALIRQWLTPLGEDPRGLRRWWTDILARRTRDPHRLLGLLIAALAETAADPMRDGLLGALFARLRDSAPPAFTTAEVWQKHALAGPFLSAQPPEPAPSRLVSVRELTNLRVFKDTPPVDVPFPLPPADTGQWLLLTGENGVGKTTFLRALALGLASPEVVSKLLDERLPMIRNGGEGRVTLEVDAGLLDAVVRFKGRTETVETGPNEPAGARRPWVVGYGVRRGNARGEPDREPEWGPTGELHTLFDRPATLVNAGDWLIKLERQVLREERQQTSEPLGGGTGSRASIWKSVTRALETLLGITTIEPEDEHVFVRHPHFGRVRLDALSDGYLTTTGWVIDLIARWLDRQRVLDEPVGRDILRQMTGFVLIDEIDLHLHPVWQMRIVDAVRRLFPRMSFVVTTHNPLTLQGARRGEVYVMRRDGGRIELVQRDIHPGYDVDRVLFEQFGVEHTLDKETRDLLRLHREKLERGAPREDPERIALEAQLADRLGGVGEIVRAERRGAGDPLPRLSPDKRHLLAPFLKKTPS